MNRTSRIPSLFPLLILFLTLSSLPNPSTSDTDSFIYGGCSQLTYAPSSPYESILNSLLTSLVNSATYSSFSKFTIYGATKQDVIYGLYQCRGDLSMTDCADCVEHAVSQLGVFCPSATGGALQLQGCFVKYDNTSFLGVEDKTVVLKKCGPPVGYESDLTSQVLDGLAGGNGLFRVGGSGDVQGTAQCVGDLSANQCQDCVSSAIGKLRSDCGAAAYGDMFLAKCYVRYSTGGDYPKASSGSSSSSSSDSEHDETQKTLAIIIGMVAAVALIIIFVSYMNRYWEKKAAGK